jgi:NADH-ubiquinone oxidoreductase chain 5
MKVYSMNKFLNRYNLRNFLCLIWFIPNLFTYGVNYYFLNLSQKLLNNIDIGWREYYRGQGIFNIIKNYSIFYYFYQINNFRIYLFRFVLWILIILLILLI